MVLVNLKDLKENIVEYLIKIGVDSSIKNCTFLDSIKEEIIEVLESEKFDKGDAFIMCNLADNSISLNINNHGVRCDLKLMKTVDNKILINISKIYDKNIKMYEKVIDINNRTISTNEGLFKNSLDEETNNKTMTIEKKYDEDGIMSEYEIIRFKPNNIITGLDENYKDVILHIPHTYKESSLWSENYLSKVSLIRTYFDLANIKIDYKESGMKYESVIQLAYDLGLRDMVLPDSFREGLPKDFIIDPMENAEIEDIFNNLDEKVRNGLKKYIKDRSTYRYNSKEDPNFKHEIKR